MEDNSSDMNPLHPAYQKWIALKQALPIECEGCLGCKKHTRDYTRKTEAVSRDVRSKRIHREKKDINWRME